MCWCRWGRKGWFPTTEAIHSSSGQQGVHCEQRAESHWCPPPMKHVVRRKEAISHWRWVCFKTTLKYNSDKRPHVVWVHWCGMSGVDKRMETESQGLPGARGKGDGEWLLVGTGFSFGVMKASWTSWNETEVVVVQSLECPKCHSVVYLKNGPSGRFYVTCFLTHTGWIWQNSLDGRDRDKIQVKGQLVGLWDGSVSRWLDSRSPLSFGVKAAQPHPSFPQGLCLCLPQAHVE